MNIPLDRVQSCPIHETDFCKWKLESQWDQGIFIRQKTYIEHVTHTGYDKIDDPYFNVICAGMPDKCKNLLVRSLCGDPAKDDEDAEIKKFLKEKRKLSDFKSGLAIPGKLYPHRIRGGIVLLEDLYQLR